MNRRLRPFSVIVILVGVLGLTAACGGGDKSSAPNETTTQAAASNKAARLPVLPRAQKPAVKSHYFVSRNVRTMDEYLTRVLNRVDAFWSRSFARAGLPEPQVKYVWPAPGKSYITQCNENTNDDTAAYCGPDDTIYISTQFAYDLWRGFLRRTATGAAPGDFGVAYVVAHEYAHQVQDELGIRPHGQVKIHELQADCLAGVWANSEYYAGQLEGKDYNKAVSTAELVGDYNFTSEGHHGTPAERVAAWRLGYNTGSGARCGSTYNP